MKKVIMITSILFGIALTITAITSFGRYVSHASPEAAPHIEIEQAEEKAFVFDCIIDGEILDAMEAAEQKAKEYASGRLDSWISELLTRTDVFLEDYFKLLNIKKREMSAAWHAISHKIDKGVPSAEEVIMNDLMARFENEVLNRTDAQRIINDIGRQAATIFMNSFEHGLNEVQGKYSVPEQDWEKHISKLCGYAAGFENRQVSIAAKISIACSVAMGAEVVYTIVSTIVKKISKNLAVKTGTMAFGSTGIKIAGKAVPVVGWIVSAGLVGWDIYDVLATAERDKRDMRAGIEQYLREMKAHLLGPAKDSIMGSICLWEKELRGRVYSLG